MRRSDLAQPLDGAGVEMFSQRENRAVDHQRVLVVELALDRFDDGRIELDTNIVERGIRPIVLNRKNALFAGHDEGAANWACIASLVETCKLSGVDPQAYFADVLTKLVNLWPAARLDELMPWEWTAEQSASNIAA